MVGQIRRASALVPVVVLLIGCREGSPVVPTEIRRDMNGDPIGFSVTGSVQDTSSWPCGGCTVEMVDGPLAGTTTLTDAVGRFAFFVPGTFSPPLTLRVLRDGYHTATRAVQAVSPTLMFTPETVEFELEAIAPSRNLTGTYSLTFTAHSSCTRLPDQVRRRTYRVTFVPFPGHPTWFRGAPVGEPLAAFRLFVGVAGNFMGFDTDSDLSQGIVEELTPTTSVFIWGWGGATVPDFPIVVPFKGEISYCPVAVTRAGGITRCPAPVSCASDEHVLTFSEM